MIPRPAHIPPQTSKQAKAAYKKHGFRLSVRDIREIERAEELQRRADRIKEQERRKKLAQKRKAEKEQRDRETRAKLGVGLATQLAGYSHSQHRMKNGMESFLKMGRVGDRSREGVAEKARGAMEVLSDEKEKEEDKEKEQEEQDKALRDEGSIVQTDISCREYASKPGSVPDRLDDGLLLETDSREASEPWDIEDVDDETFIDAIQGEASAPHRHTPKAPQQSEQKQEVGSANRREDSRFIRLHGPVDAAIERLLDSLPDPAVELLSEDTSSNPCSWNPAPSLLHRLKPPGLPLHRLRIKVGCTVILLASLKSNIQISEKSHLRILRIAKERLECVVLDGQLEGTKSILTRVPFSARYRNEDQYSFIRSQFPVRVSINQFRLQEKPAEAKNDRKRPIAIHGNIGDPSEIKKPKVPEPFLKPSIPASRALENPAAPKPLGIAPNMIDSWEDFLASSTQIARELSPGPVLETQKPMVGLPDFMPCTQDLDFSAEDLEELEGSITNDVPQIPQEIMPNICPTRSVQNTTNKTPSKPRSYRSSASNTPTTALQKPTFTNQNVNRGLMLPPPLPAPSRLIKSAAQHKTSPPHRSKPAVRNHEQSMMPSLKDFGISTQDLASIIEDDLPFSSPPIPV